MTRKELDRERAKHLKRMQKKYALEPPVSKRDKPGRQSMRQDYGSKDKRGKRIRWDDEYLPPPDLLKFIGFR